MKENDHSMSSHFSFQYTKKKTSESESEPERFPNHRWYSDATWGKMGECPHLEKKGTQMCRYLTSE